MCGITGILNLKGDGEPIEQRPLRQMLAMIQHRGPDQSGIYLNRRVGLGSARLSILDLSTGQQPICNEDGTLWIVYNGEVFNYAELQPQLERRNHRLSTQSDTEVILHLYEEYGPGCLSYLNGQFALAIWNEREQTLFLARDRLGVRPLFYTVVDDVLIFGSEIKALLADPRVYARLDPMGLNQIFTYWTTLSPRTIFQNIFEVPPGHFMLVRNGELAVKSYWTIGFPENGGAGDKRNLEDCLAEFQALLVDAVRIRLHADVPVGAYLSGGLDSSVTCAIIRNFIGKSLTTFSITFGDPNFDERDFQCRMARYLGTEHYITPVTYQDIGRVFPETIWHTETPILRTSPAPMFLLSRLVRDHHFKVVLTGEGADEFLAGYDIFKEMKIRRFWARQPESPFRPLLLQRLYADIPGLAETSAAYRTAFFRQRLADTDAPLYSHMLRWYNTSRTKRFFSSALQSAIQADRQFGQPDSLPLDEIVLPPGFARWHPLSRAQYLEITIFMSQYLLSAQGDRMGMAHSVEGRFPFLDYRLVEFANQLPPHYKLRALTEKYILKRLGQAWLPDEIWQRTKRPYRAPIHASFFHQNPPAYVSELLSPAYVNSVGLFKAEAVSQLVNKIQRNLPISETDDMALVGILSTHLVYEQFVTTAPTLPPLAVDGLKICDKSSALEGV